MRSWVDTVLSRSLYIPTFELSLEAALYSTPASEMRQPNIGCPANLFTIDKHFQRASLNAGMTQKVMRVPSQMLPNTGILTDSTHFPQLSSPTAFFNAFRPSPFSFYQSRLTMKGLQIRFPHDCSVIKASARLSDSYSPCVVS